jgi:hypothetical protein
MGMIRSLISLSFLAVFLFVGFTVPLGERTLFGHVSNIWSADETQELVDGVKETSVPFVDRVKRGVQAGLADDEDATPSGEAPVEGSEPDAEKL